MTQKDLEAKTIQTYDDNAQQWASSHAVVNSWLPVIARFHELLSSGSILEVGCGGGRDAKEFIRLGHNYLGTDASAGMIDVARSEVPKGSFQIRSVYDLPNIERTFDGFWACAVLLHIPKSRIDEALQAIVAVLKPGAIGMISIKDGNKEDFEVRDKKGSHEERLFVYWHKADFQKVLQNNGFSVLEYTHKPVSTRTNWHIFFVQKS